MFVFTYYSPLDKVFINYKFKKTTLTSKQTLSLVVPFSWGPDHLEKSGNLPSVSSDHPKTVSPNGA